MLRYKSTDYQPCSLAVVRNCPADKIVGAEQRGRQIFPDKEAFDFHPAESLDHHRPGGTQWRTNFVERNLWLRVRRTIAVAKGLFQRRGGQCVFTSATQDSERPVPAAKYGGGSEANSDRD